MDELKEVLKNPKKKALIQLGFYAIFFVFVFILIATNDTTTNNSYEDYVNYSSEENKTSTISSYDYTYTIDTGDNVEIVTGTYTSSLEEFTYQNKTYTIKNNQVYLLDEVVLDYFKTSDYHYDKIENLIKDITPEEVTTYKDGTKKEVYTIPYEKYYNTTKCDICYDIPVIVKRSEYISEVEIDLTQNYKMLKFVINIKYSNVK